jgi:hypothetical protein
MCQKIEEKKRIFEGSVNILERSWSRVFWEGSREEPNTCGQSFQLIPLLNNKFQSGFLFTLPLYTVPKKLVCPKSIA